MKRPWRPKLPALIARRMRRGCPLGVLVLCSRESTVWLEASFGSFQMPRHLGVRPHWGQE